MSDPIQMTSPTIIDRVAQPYVAYRESVTMQQVPEPARHFAAIYGWLGERGIAPTDAPFYKFDLIDMAHELVIEAGVPVAAVPEVPAEMVAGVLPAGRYVTVTHTGHPDELMEVTRRLLEWGDQQGLTWDHTETEGGDAWACRLEIYHSNPQDEPDMTKWETDLVFRLAD